MIEINNISVIYGERAVLDNISLNLTYGDKIGVIGKNGCGKSTLLKILAGMQLPDEGSFAMPSGTSIGFLHQDINIDLRPSVKEACLSGLRELKTIELQLNALKEKAEWGHELNPEEGIKLSELEERFRLLGGYNQEAMAERILKGLGFSPADIGKKVGELSGGWRMRVELAKILLARPDLLLLDEPTNHLDMESIIWLEAWLTNFEGTALIVSHDAEFLENATQSILEIQGGSAFYFKGKYSLYLKTRKERMENQLRAFENQQKDVQDRQRTIDRFRAKATKAKMAKSMEKQLEKMELVERPEEDTTSIRFRFQPPPRSGDIVVRVSGLSKSFDNLKVLEKVDFQIRRGEKVSLVGKNGEGKTTFIRLILGQLEKDSGEVEFGHNVQIGYFAQNQDKLLDGELTLLEYMEEGCPNELRPRLRGILGNFLFSNEDVEKKIKILSGGERSRLAMAKMLLRPFNLLILDEPTNHLDMLAKDVLKQTIELFEGTVIIVSHDRDFLRGLSDRTIEFAGRKTHEYLGDIDYFLEKKGKENIREFEKKDDKPYNPASPVSATVSKQDDFQLRKTLNRTISYCERKIQQLEDQISRIEEKLSDPDFHLNPESIELTKTYSRLKIELEEENVKWDQAVEELDMLDT